MLPISWMRLTVDDPRRLEIASSRGDLVVDSHRRVISRRGEVIAKFEEIKFIVLCKIRRGEYGIFWSVRLHRGPLVNIDLGACEDDLDASLIAARISKALDVPVKYW
ncbi:hypothetical protein KAK11_02945 [Ideonella paludis]|uniref:Uncharacterized protein n=2 Tax=Ideonella paludis TaxID=1233411 RepID=A0ABS5DSZ6_9BURK|nr:hypothetical protein [Ideonella paludis]